MHNLIGLKQLRLNMGDYTRLVEQGESFVVLKNSKPIFKITPIDSNDNWEEVVDFTKLKSGGINLDELLARL